MANQLPWLLRRTLRNLELEATIVRADSRILKPYLSQLRCRHIAVGRAEIGRTQPSIFHFPGFETMQNMISSELASPAALQSTRRVIRKASPTEMIYIATETIVVSRSRVIGAVIRTQFETAVAHLEARYGILRSVVEDGHFLERAADRSAVEAWSASELCSAEAMYARLLNADLDVQESVYGIYVIASDDALDIFMLSSHAITDATSLVELHSCLAYMCDCVVRQVTPALEEQSFPQPVDAAVERSLALLPAGRNDLASSWSGAFAEIPMRAPRDGRPVRHRLERIVIEADDMDRIHAAGHANGCSVHALLLAAFALAIREVSEGSPRQILVRSSVDMRRRLEPHISTELVFSAITGHITPIPDLDQPLFAIARHIFNNVHDGALSGNIFRDYVNYPKTFGSPQQAPVALNVSDMQAVKFPWSTKHLTVAGFEYALGWLKKFPNVSVSIFEGTLIATVVYVEQFADPLIMRRISKSFVKRLMSATAY
jgi:hypothetical protein